MSLEGNWYQNVKRCVNWTLPNCKTAPIFLRIWLISESSWSPVRPVSTWLALKRLDWADIRRVQIRIVSQQLTLIFYVQLLVVLKRKIFMMVLPLASLELQCFMHDFCCCLALWSSGLHNNYSNVITFQIIFIDDCYVFSFCIKYRFSLLLNNCITNSLWIANSFSSDYFIANTFILLDVLLSLTKNEENCLYS